MTIIAPTPCMLKGAYGWFRKVGTDNVFIRETVHGCEIEDKSYVLTWAVLDDLDEPGMQEAFYCHVEYNKEQETATQTQIYAKTMDGKNIDIGSWDAAAPDTWCGDENEDCKRQTTDQWTRLLTDPETNFPFDNQDDEKSAVSCSVWRAAKTPNNAVEIKLGMPYKVKTGYKIYATNTALAAGDVKSSGNGLIQEMTFDAASYVLAGATILASSLAF